MAIRIEKPKYAFNSSTVTFSQSRYAAAPNTWLAYLLVSFTMFPRSSRVKYKPKTASGVAGMA